MDPNQAQQPNPQPQAQAPQPAPQQQPAQQPSGNNPPPNQPGAPKSKNMKFIVFIGMLVVIGVGFLLFLLLQLIS